MLNTLNAYDDVNVDAETYPRDMRMQFFSITGATWRKRGKCRGKYILLDAITHIRIFSLCSRESPRNVGNGS